MSALGVAPRRSRLLVAVILAAAMLTTGCDGFLDELDQLTRAVDTVTDPTHCDDATATATLPGGPTAMKSGAEACAGPATASQTGSGTDAQVSAGIEPAFAQLGQQVQSFALQCATVVTGVALSGPTSCATTTTQSLPYSAGASGGQVVAFATLLEISTAPGGATAAVASASLDCGNGPVSLPVNGAGFTFVPVAGTAGSCTVTASLQGGGSGDAGSSLQRLTVMLTGPTGGCVAHEQCRDSTPDTPFCGPTGSCQSGQTGEPCLHDSQCDRAGGLLCNSSGVCSTGELGTACYEDPDCHAPFFCDLATFPGTCSPAG
jgi:hypothetical protein